MGRIRVDEITDEAGTGAPSFPNGVNAADLTGTLPAIDGSSLTDLNAAELTGTLPAIDGSALTGVGPSTTFDAVGTYAFVVDYANVSGGAGTAGDTKSGSTLRRAQIGRSNVNQETGVAGSWDLGGGSGTLSGTWRMMSDANYRTHATFMFLAVRIS